MAIAIFRHTRMFHTQNGLPESVRVHMIELLNAALANMADVETHLRHAHWNVKGPQFYGLHELFGEIASKIREHSDEIAERITALGGMANGTARQIVAASTIAEYPLDAVKGEDHLHGLTRGLAATVAQLRTCIAAADQLDDQATADLLTGIVFDREKDMWLLEAHYQEEKTG